jgi:hypothetical protein
VIPQEEFDFESSNAKFEKDEIESPVVEESKQSGYSKSSFFDDISSDLKDRTDNEGYNN